LGGVDRVICISRFTADEAMALLGLPSTKIQVVYNGGDFHPGDKTVTEEKPEFNVPDEFFLFVGSLEPGKNWRCSPRPTDAAERQKPLPPLLIVGARWAGVGNEGKPPGGWQYLGRQPDAVLVYLYRRATGFVFRANMKDLVCLLWKLWPWVARSSAPRSRVCPRSVAKRSFGVN